MTSLEGPNMTDVQKSLPGKTKVRKTSLGLASTRSYYVKKPPQAPFSQIHGADGTGRRSASTTRADDDMLEEFESRGEMEEVVFENTYRVGPDPQKKFSTAAVKKIAQEVLTERLTDVCYDPKVCRGLTLQISDEVKSHVKQLGFDRYKIVCLTHIGPKMGQGLRVGSMCCWDEKVDNFAECSFMNKTLFAVSLVFGIYQE